MVDEELRKLIFINNQIYARLGDLGKLGEKIMAAIDDLNANVAKLATDAAALIAQGANSVPAAQVEAAAQAVAAIDTTVVAALVPATNGPAKA